MNNIEEKLWNYIDGTCSPQEQQSIAMLIGQNEAYKQKYNELLLLNQEFNAIELDEPSMGFTYKVMENIRAEQAMKPLKSAINKRIVIGISAFFILAIAALVILMLGNIDWATTDAGMSIPEVNVKQINSFFTAPVLKGFLFFDVVMGLFILDTYLRRKNMAKG